MEIKVKDYAEVTAKCAKLEKENEDLRHDIARHIAIISELEYDRSALLDLIDAADCPQCENKSGAYYDNYGEVYQCQWCYEVNKLKEQEK